MNDNEKALTNRDRAGIAELALTMVEDGQGRQDAVTDLLANLMHLCDQEGWAFFELLDLAESHYGQECDESADHLQCRVCGTETQDVPICDACDARLAS